MLHVRSVSTGVAGSPYYTNLYFSGGAGDTEYVLNTTRAFWVALQVRMGTGLVTNVDSEVREVNEETGDVVAIRTGPSISSVTGTATGSMCPPATQGLIRLTTGTLRSNRRVQGRIFIPRVPQSQVTAQGTALNAYQTALADAGAILMGGAGTPRLVVWSRPQLTPGDPNPRLGAAAPVTGASAWEQFSVLRSRRD